MISDLILADDKNRLDFLTSLAKSVNKPASQDAYVFATVAVADIQLRQKDYDGARKKLDECEQILDTFDSVENSVHASFYRASAEYYKVGNTMPDMTVAGWQCTHSVCRGKTNSPRTIKTRFSTSPASTSRTSTFVNVKPGLTTSPSPLSSQTLFTTLANSSFIQF